VTGSQLVLAVVMGEREKTFVGIAVGEKLIDMGYCHAFIGIIGSLGIYLTRRCGGRVLLMA
jgi:hypothetical protein